MIGPALPYFYVSARDGKRFWLLAGPYPTEASARVKMTAVSEIACQQNPKAHFYSLGACGTPDERKTPLGKEF